VSDVPSRQDQLHSYQYSLQRVVAALVTHDPDPHRSPLRRAGTTALVSLVVAALALTGAAIWGILTGAGSSTIDDETAVYLEKGTGAAYVYLKSDSKLHPVLNYTSGLLIASASSPNVVNVSRKSLATVALGDPLGIPNAPDSLPGSGDLLTGRWSVCTQVPDQSSGGQTPRSTLLIGDALSDGTIAANPGSARPALALLVRDTTDQTFLVYGNRRFLIPPNRNFETLRAFEWGDQIPWPVAAAWINAIPKGPDLRPPGIDGIGDDSAVPGAKVGQLLTDGQQWAVVLADGTAPITEVQARLMQAGGVTPVNIGSADLYKLPPSRTRLAGAADGLPATLPPLADRPERACMTLPVGKDGDGLRLNPTFATGIVIPAGSNVSGAVQAEFVHLRRGTGALVVAATSPTAPASTGTISIVTDDGRRYPLANRDTLGRLGYGGVDPVQVSAQMIALLPQGPSLDATKARQSHPGG
jgi:type VII secretion protein EccB